MQNIAMRPSYHVRRVFLDLTAFNPLNPELNPICYLLALLELTIFSTLTG